MVNRKVLLCKNTSKIFSKFYKPQTTKWSNAAMFSYQVLLPEDYEELLADIISTYGNEIVMVTNKVFKKIKGM